MSHKRKYTVTNYDDLYQVEANQNENRIEALRDRDIKTMRVKTIKSGDMLECEIYPIWKTSKNRNREKKSKESRKEQKNLNDKNARKNAIRTLNTNFTYEDIWATFTYAPGKLPKDPEDANRIFQNYLSRIRRYMKKNALGELKYIYVTECITDEEGKEGHAHHHIVMNFRDRDAAERLWNHGGRTQTRRLQPDDFGLEGMARYITKASKGTKRYVPSRNLKKPKITISDEKMTKKKAERIAKDPGSAHEVFQKYYPQYLFNDISVKFSDFVSGAYLYVRMRKLPPEKKVNRKRKT